MMAPCCSTRWHETNKDTQMIDDQFAKSRLYFEGLLPGNIYRLRNRSFAQIMGVHNNEEEARQIDPEQLIDVAKKC